MDEKPKILVVDDEDSHRIMLRAVLSEDGYAVTEAADGTDAIMAVEKEAFDVILLDIRMTTMDGIEALTEIRKMSPLVPVLIMTAYASVKTAVEALKAGAFDYLTKPLDIEELKILIEKTLEHYHLRAENLVLKERLGDRFDFTRIIGRSPKMKSLLDTLAMVAPSDATVLIMGESGTGKEVVANAIHHNSPRAGQPFIKVSCASLPETLLESELFGHKKGAFTGAVYRREGRFQLAHRGTIFLDEVGEMSRATQMKLLRALQEKEFEPVGSAQTIKVDIRVIAATNKDLEKDVKDGRFREDLYYRLNVVPIVLPPLRERKEDISPLTDHFLALYGEKNRKSLKGLSGKALDLLVRYDWPGNIRELENCIERAVIMAREEVIVPADFPPQIQMLSREEGTNGFNIPSGISLEEMERALIVKTLAETDGNRTRASEILGINRRTLQNKLKQYGLNTPPSRPA
ncbi:MAG: two-component system response regulator [Deltaproteobacteria bacterium RBG_16_58_17]|nr:MAG: two-component system response regulator [Deltaproteobacteria bacterium RBG_16_58_17]OHE21156.1 MAG: two-component system response regulator [Syntrophobacterales bacterium GWF2_56_9]